MVTLRDFITILNVDDHFRVFAPNRDCLVYESFNSIHSGLFYFEEPLRSARYWKSTYTETKRDPKYPWKRYLDAGTKKFLAKYGDQVVYSVEVCSIEPESTVYDTKTKKMTFDHNVTDNKYGYKRKSVHCIDLYIIPAEAYEHDFSKENLELEEKKYREEMKDEKKLSSKKKTKNTKRSTKKPA